MKLLQELINTIAASEQLEGNQIKVCDIGGTATYWKIFPFNDFPNLIFKIDLFNMDYHGDSETVQLPSNVTIERHVANGCSLSDISDNDYHLCHSNSVIEHVGNWKAILSMARETLRVSRYQYLQTPNFWFPIEPHFLLPFYAGLPRPLRIWLQVTFRNKEFPDSAMAADESVRLLTKRELKTLFPACKIHRERFALFTKSFIVVGQPRPAD